MLRMTVLLSACAFPFWAAAEGVPVGTCTSASMQVSVFAGDAKFPVTLRLASEDTAIPAIAQKVFGDLGATGNSTEAQIILSIILRENGTDQVSIQRYGSERLIEDATCDDGAALRTFVAESLP